MNRSAGEVAVVAHGGTLRVLNAYLRGIPVERMGWEPLANGCILRSLAGLAAPLLARLERKIKINEAR